ncbi:hypothetical protein [Lichenicoccus sp.]|uniref:hypothetical protein n=1 Tax=Lichenicoccus sp. TaxID=2781899 RepID=UPI003D0F3C87
MLERHPVRLAGMLLAAACLLPIAAVRAAEGQEPAPRTVSAIPLDNVALSNGLVVQAHAEVLRPAPLPDLDVSAPGPSSDALEAQASPSVAPDLFNPQAHVAGDGYASGSSIDADHNNRHSTGGGMSLSIPVQ